MINNYILNPAVGGIDPYFQAISTNRYQWVGITDAPRTNILSVNGPTKSLKVGLGGILYTDIVGPTRRTGVSFSYSYHMNLTAKTKLSFGLSGGLLQYRVDGSKIQLRDPSDLVVTNSVQSLLTPDFGVGFHFHSVDKVWYLGASIPQILQKKVEFYNISTSSTSTLARHIFVTGGYNFYLSENFKLEPSFCLQFVTPAPLQYDIGLRLKYQNKLWLGCVYRSEDAVAALIGYSTKSDVSFAYSYDFTTSNLRKYSSGTHELMIAILFGRVSKNAITK